MKSKLLMGSLAWSGNHGSLALAPIEYIGVVSRKLVVSGPGGYLYSYVGDPKKMGRFTKSKTNKINNNITTSL